MNESSELTLADRILLVQRRLAEACERCQRDPREVELVTVSKTRPPEVIAEAVACGLRVFGENKVQEAQAKMPLCSEAISWHLIGHLQSNKAKVAVRLFDMIHSVDSQDLLMKLESEARLADRRLKVLLQVNVGGEPSKSGMTPEDLPGVLEASLQCTQLTVEGLMTIPPFLQEIERTRPFFASLRALRDRAETDWGMPLRHLSMGMSHDFEIAIAEGATMVRVGTDIFGPR